MSRFSRKQQPEELPRRRHQSSTGQEMSERSTYPQRFRRNLTLTGSKSAHISSSTENNGTMLSPRAQVHHLHLHRRRLLYRFIGVVVVCLGVYLFIGQLISANTVTLTSGRLTDSQLTAYKHSIESYFNQRPAERFYPILDISSLTKAVQVNHPEVKSIDITLTGVPGEVVTTIVVRKPVARWTVDGKEEFVDGSGRVFTINAFSRPSVEIVDETGLDQVGQATVTSDRFLSFVGQVVSSMAVNGYTVERTTMPLLTSRQLDVSLRGVPYRIKMITGRPVSEQVEDATRVIAYLQKQGITPEYIDVRVSGKAFYK